MDIIDRKQAMKEGLTYYFTGTPCSKGHVSQRLVLNRSCQECRREQGRERKYHRTEAAKAAAARYQKENPKIGLMHGAKTRAKKLGLDFNLTYEDIVIPEFCPILGTKLERGEGKPTPNSPTLDRIIPSLGYVKGNVRVISHRANTIKNDATIEELEAVIRYIRESA